LRIPHPPIGLTAKKRCGLARWPETSRVRANLPSDF
jgi:hypothetical protein